MCLIFRVRVHPTCPVKSELGAGIGICCLLVVGNDTAGRTLHFSKQGSTAGGGNSCSDDDSSSNQSRPSKYSVSNKTHSCRTHNSKQTFLGFMSDLQAAV